MLELSSLCSASAFMSLWAAACRRASDLMQNSYSVGHFLVHVVQVEFNPRLICGGAPVRLPGDKPVAEGPADSKESKELNRLQRELKVAKQELDHLRPSNKRPRGLPDANNRRDICREFQKAGSCPRGKSCRYSHECGHCGSRDHGATSSECQGRR